MERHLLLLMFASFLLRVMRLTSYKTIQGVAVRRFPSSLVMLGYCFFQKAFARFLPNRLCHVSGHVFLSCWWDEQGSCPLVSVKSKLDVFHFAKLLK